MRCLLLLVMTATIAHAQEARLRVIGIAQDGGVPHAACACERCKAARADEARAHHVASLALIVEGPEPGTERVFLVDATPDIRAQLDDLRDVRDDPPDRVDRAPVDGVLLTHAHIGHYTGLAFFGFEAVHTQGLPVWATPKMSAFLRGNAPWSQLVDIGNIEISEITPGKTFTVRDVPVVAFNVPHRDELSDTVAFIFKGETTVMYVPDTEPWRTWDVPLPVVLEREGVDVLIVDGSFYSPDELPGRPPSTIGHPLMTDTMDLLQPLVDDGRIEVIFTHLNHSNPALDPDSDARATIHERGFSVAHEGLELDLGDIE